MLALEQPPISVYFLQELGVHVGLPEYTHELLGAMDAQVVGKNELGL